MAALVDSVDPLPFNQTLNYSRSLLQQAIMVEHSTVPIYLTSLYSIGNTSSYAAKIIRSVVVEEMLHMTTSSNVLNAIGGAPIIDAPGFIPEFPLNLPMTNVSVDISPFDMWAVHNFQLIESTTKMSKSIGAAYEYVLSLLKALSEDYSEERVFTGNYSRQLFTQANNQTVHKIKNLKDATTALLGVADQGGGCPVPGKEQLWPEVANISAGPSGGVFSHLARFTEIANGRQYNPHDQLAKPTGPTIDTNWSQVYQFKANPKVSDFPLGSVAYNKSLAFAASYTQLLVQLHNVFNGAPEAFGATIGAMYQLAGSAVDLMNTTDPRNEGLGIGPAWEYVPSASRYEARNSVARPTMLKT